MSSGLEPVARVIEILETGLVHVVQGRKKGEFRAGLRAKQEEGGAVPRGSRQTEGQGAGLPPV